MSLPDPNGCPVSYRILVPVDESRWSLAALQTTLDIAKRADGADVQLTLLHVINVTQIRGKLLQDIAGLLGFEPVVVPERVEQHFRDRGQSLLDRAAARCAAVGINSRGVLDQGSVVDRIVHHAAAHDLVVMGGRGDTEAQFPGQGGGTAERILRRANATTLVVPDRQVQLDHFALAYDGSEGSGRALAATRRLAEVCGSDVTLLHVTETTPVPDPLDEARAALGDLAVGAARCGGEPHEALPAEARAQGCDLLALGYRGRGQLRDVFLGRTTEWLVGSVSLGLLVAR